MKFASHEIAERATLLQTTAEAAGRAGKSIPEYLRDLWGDADPRQIAAQMDELIDLSSCKKILEIGPGTGGFHAAVAKRCPATCEFEIYETTRDWARYLKDAYRVTVRDADGRTLSHTSSENCDLVHAHYVFV